MSKVNIPFAILSLATSILLWASVYNDSKKEPENEKVLASLTTQNLDTSKYVITEIPPSVSLPLVGYRDQLRRAMRQTTSALVDLSTATPGTKSYPIIVFPATSRELIGNTPPVTIKIEALVTKRVEVSVVRTGSLPNGFHEDAIEPSLRFVYVTGPSDTIQKVAKVQVAINLASITQTPHEDDVESKAVDANGSTVPRVILHSIDYHPEYKEEQINEPLKIHVSVRFAKDTPPSSVPPPKK
jgi:YbbR domain-containing protein